MKSKFICVSPITDKAKENFLTIMNSFHSCRVKQEKKDMIYLESLNKMYYFWVNKSKDPNWKIEK
jgi:hypothetical protein